MRNLITATLLLAGAIFATAATPADAPLPEVVEFNRHMRPLLSNTCFKCHGPDVEGNKSDLRLDIDVLAYAPREGASGQTITPIVPGKPEQSEVWRRINSADDDARMPPPDALHQLEPRDIALFKRWIEQGAVYEPHWAYIPPKKRDLPPGEARHPIDRFVQAELARHGLDPSPEADSSTLVRRLSLDLLGLPPTPEQVAAFLSDDRSDAYSRLVDELLASENYGERMAVPWLDLVRYADTVGFHGDQRQNIFPYRDYVIDAFNQNKPYDQFVREQLAGDLLPNPTEDQLVATGFNRLNMVTREGGAQPKEYLAKYAADRVRTVSTAFLGSTMACTECHDHKYDPFSTRDFYSMAAYFADIKQWGVYSDYKYTPEPELKGFNNDHPFPPEMEVENDAQKRRLARLRQQLEARIAEAVDTFLADPDATAAISAWADRVAKQLGPDGRSWTVAHIDSIQSGSRAIATALPDYSALFVEPPEDEGSDEQEDPKEENAEPAIPEDTQILTLQTQPGILASVRLQALPDKAHDGKVARNELGRFALKLKLAVHRAGADEPEELEIADAYAHGKSNTYFNGYLLPTVTEEWVSDRDRPTDPQSADYLLRHPVSLNEGDRLIATIDSRHLGRVRLATSPLSGRLPNENLSSQELAAFQTPSRNRQQLEAVAAWYYRSADATDGTQLEPVHDLLREISACRDGRASTMVTVATDPLTTRVLPRGNWQDDSGEIVLPEPPRFLTGAEESPEERANRLDLANWITSPDNPLTARTFVNRLWKQFFGTALSATVDDLGLQGEYPSHPDLLDWLSVEFVESGWDIKALVKLIVTSHTYQQSSVNRPELREIDPQNRLLARQSARRLQAEFIRDNALAAAGLLNPELGGPSVKPYQPEGYYAQLNFPLREYEPHLDERQYRRGVYMHWQRTFLHPMLANFDAPSREECAADRTVSSTPQQALTLLNDPTFVEAARVLAENVMQETPAGDFSARLENLYMRALARPPSPRESESLQAHLEEQLKVYRDSPEDADKLASVGLYPAGNVDRIQLAAWTSVARIVLNLNETIVRY